MKEKVFLGIGSNLGNRVENIHTAIKLIGILCGTVNARSSIYQTAAWGRTDQPDFLNQVIELSSFLTPQELLLALLGIEVKMGRTRDQKWGARIIDLDILYFDNLILVSNELIVPHPHIANRRFVIEPLCEIAPAFIHPVLKKSNSILLKECDDSLSVEKFSTNF